MCVYIRDQLYHLLLILFSLFPSPSSSFHIVLHRGRAAIISLFMTAFVFFGPPATHTLPSSVFLAPHLFFRGPYATMLAIVMLDLSSSLLPLSVNERQGERVCSSSSPKYCQTHD